ncbi:MAG: Gmad2 immunoglobulin-like domain-containing protein [Carboxydocellales bacterium]
MKRIIILLLLIGVTLSGCTLGGKKMPPATTGLDEQGEQGENPQPGVGQAGGPKSQQDYYVGLQAPVPNLTDWVNRYKQYEGIFQQKAGNYQVLLASWGEMFSKGYAVKVDRVSKQAGKWVVEVSLYRPSIEDYSGASTYAYEVVSIVADGSPIEVLAGTAEKGATGNSIAENGTITGKKPAQVIVIPEGKQLAVSKNFVVFTPPEGEKITSPVTIQGKARVFEATFRIGIEDGHNMLADQMVMADQGGPGWGNFQVKLPFTQPTNPSGMIILYYHSMKDGERIEEILLPVKFK